MFTVNSRHCRPVVSLLHRAACRPATAQQTDRVATGVAGGAAGTFAG
jgi:hypothetical protein